jgi:hypothetical protein
MERGLIPMLSREEIEEIVEKDLPGYIVVEEPLVDEGFPKMEPEAVTPDLEHLRQKYEAEGFPCPRDGETGTTSNWEDHSPASSDEAEDIIVVVQPKGADDTRNTGPAPKAVVISSEAKRIVSIQG